MSLPHHTRPEHALSFGIFTSAQAGAAGHSTSQIRAHVRADRWVQLERGLLARRDRLAHPLDDVVRAVLRAGPSAMASHLTAAAALGWDLLETSRQVHLTVPRDCTRARGGPSVVLHSADAVDVMVVGGVLPVTGPWRTLRDIARTRSFDEAVVAVDAALRSGSVRWQAVCDARARATRGRYARVLGAASPLAGSVPETVARLLLLDAGLPAPVEQYEIRSGGWLLARVDLAWPEARLAVEIDGWSVHGGREAFDTDRLRQNPLELEGWTVLRYSPRMLRDHPERLVADVRAALGSL